MYDILDIVILYTDNDLDQGQHELFVTLLTDRQTSGKCRCSLNG